MGISSSGETIVKSECRVRFPTPSAYRLPILAMGRGMGMVIMWQTAPPAGRPSTENSAWGGSGSSPQQPPLGWIGPRRRRGPQTRRHVGDETARLRALARVRRVRR